MGPVIRCGFLDHLFPVVLDPVPPGPICESKLESYDLGSVNRDHWYVSSGLGRYQLIYGSLGAIVALLFVIYLLAIITLFGAHLSAAIDCKE